MFSWLDLTTADADAAKAFYRELFGWGFDDIETAGGGAYSICKLGGDEVAAIASATQT